MIRRFLLCFLVIFLFSFPFFAFANSNKISIEYYYQPNCQECREIQQLILSAITDEIGNKFVLEKYDLSIKANFIRLITILDRLKEDSNHPVYMIVNGKRCLGGLKNIQEQLKSAIDTEYALGPSFNTSEKAESLHFAERLKIGTVFTAGFLDGINPCVFITLIFFMSILSAAKVSRKQLVMIGTIYIIACFLTYFLLGIGLYQLADFSVQTSYLKGILNYGMAGLLLFLSVISFRDAFAFHKTGEASVISLQLPDRIKTVIHALMRQLRRRGFLPFWIFILGIAVTLLESVCTGQVYIPTILLFVEKNGIISSGLLYLLLYNTAFILPLIAVFTMYFLGISIFTLTSFSRKHVVISKILIGAFFLFLSILLLLFAVR